MKRMLAILLMVAWTGTVAFAQKSAVNSAYTHYGNQYWDKAKRYIDAASVHPDTKDDAKTWMFRGNIYLMIANEQASEKPNPKYANLCENAIDTAYEAYRKASQLNPDIRVSMRIADPVTGLAFCSDFFFNQAYTALKEEKYDWAYDRGEKAYKSNPKDENAYYIYALAAELSGHKDVAKQQYYNMTKAKVKRNEPYIRLAMMYKEEGDTNRAIKVIRQHSVLKDTSSNAKVNVEYATQEAIIYAWAGDNEKSMQVMNRALEQNPDNPVLMINMGKELIGVKNYEKAEELLKKAQTLQPDNYYVYYNLGNCYYNRSSDISKSMNDIADDNEYAKTAAVYQQLLRDALPYLEKAESINGMDHNTLVMLKQVYTRIEVNEGEPDFKEKLKAVEAKLKELESQK
ncbi:MAG: tetratricopeptide repeat protein, partial [Bacteroidales bacterium]|nr:tetratricopeptide repeat protein [Bacteroidales bacterium]